MDRRRAAGSLLALAACVAFATAAPTASNHTALDLYDGAPDGCYYNFQHYGEGDRIMTNEPCLNCTCHNRMLMCYLRVCPFTKPIGQDCTIEKRADQCCPIVTCPDVPVDLLTSTTTSPTEYGATGIGKLDKYGCSINGKYFAEGSKVPPTPNKPCEHCYCIRNMTTCVMQECTLHVDGCTPIYHKDVCCPVRYSCDHDDDEILQLDDMSTTVRPTPGFLLTTTTLSPVTQMSQDCVYDGQIFADGALIKTEKACDHCYCMKGDIVCVVQECGTPMENEGKNCTALPPREGVCCPDTYICEGDEPTTGSYEYNEIITEMPQESLLTTPARRTGSEGSGYRNEDKTPFTEMPTPESEVEGSGEHVTEGMTQFSPTDESEESHEYISVQPNLSSQSDLSAITSSPEMSVTTEELQETEGSGQEEEEKPFEDISKTPSTLEQFQTSTSSYEHDEKVETTVVHKSPEVPEDGVDLKETVEATSAIPEKDVDLKETDESTSATTEKDVDLKETIESTSAKPEKEEDVKDTDESISATSEKEVDEKETVESTSILPEKEVDVKETAEYTTATPGKEVDLKETVEPTSAIPEKEEDEKETVEPTSATPEKEEDVKETDESTSATPEKEETVKETVESTSATPEKEDDVNATDGVITTATPEKEEDVKETVESTSATPEKEEDVKEIDESTSATPEKEEDVKETVESTSATPEKEEDVKETDESTSATPEKEEDVKEMVEPTSTTPEKEEDVKKAVESTSATPEKEEDVKETDESTSATPEKEEDVKETVESTSATPAKEEDVKETDESTSATPEKEDDVKPTDDSTTATPEKEVDEKETAEYSTALPEKDVDIKAVTVESTSAIPERDVDLKEPVDFTSTALPSLDEQEKDTTHLPDVNIISTVVYETSKKQTVKPELQFKTSTSIAPGKEEEISTESFDSITDSTVGIDLDLSHHNAVTTSTPLLEEVEKDSTEFDKKDHTTSYDFVSSTTSASDTPVESVDKQTETEIPEEFSTEHIPSSIFESDLLTTASIDEDHVTYSEESVTKSPVMDDREKKTTLMSDSMTTIQEHVDSDILRTTLPSEPTAYTTSEPDKGLNTIPSGSHDEDTSDQTISTSKPMAADDATESTPKTEKATISSIDELIETETSTEQEPVEQETTDEKTLETGEMMTEKSTSSVISQEDIKSTTPADHYTSVSETTEHTQTEKETTEFIGTTSKIMLESTDKPEIISIPEITETTTVNLEENEIIYESRIPGEGDCLVNGITYKNESAVPSSKKCETGCKCLSSIVKCDPIICSDPPEYMDNCRTMYDSPDSCCPTYICDQKSETMPPQPHSQMSGTESPETKPVECHGDECEIIEQDTGKKPCSSDNCGDNVDEPQEISPPTNVADHQTSIQCSSDGNCQSVPEKSCEGDNCKSPDTILPEQNEPCHGENCNVVTDKAEEGQHLNDICQGKEGCEKPLDVIEQECTGETCRRKETIPAQQIPDCSGNNCDTSPISGQSPEFSSDITTQKTNEEFETKMPVTEITTEGTYDAKITTVLPQKSEPPSYTDVATPDAVTVEQQIIPERSSTEPTSITTEQSDLLNKFDDNVTKESADYPKASDSTPTIDREIVTTQPQLITEQSPISDAVTSTSDVTESDKASTPVSEDGTKIREPEIDTVTSSTIGITEEIVTKQSVEQEKDSEIITISPITDNIEVTTPQREMFVTQQVTTSIPEISSEESSMTGDLEPSSDLPIEYDAESHVTSSNKPEEDKKETTVVVENLSTPTKGPDSEQIDSSPTPGLESPSSPEPEHDSSMNLTTEETEKISDENVSTTSKMPEIETEKADTEMMTTVFTPKDEVTELTPSTEASDSTQIDSVIKESTHISTGDEKVQETTLTPTVDQETSADLDQVKDITESSEIYKTTESSIVGDDVSSSQPVEHLTESAIYTTTLSNLDELEENTKIEEVPKLTEAEPAKETSAPTTEVPITLSTRRDGASIEIENPITETAEAVESITKISDQITTESIQIEPEMTTLPSLDVSSKTPEKDTNLESSTLLEKQDELESATKESETTEKVVSQAEQDSSIVTDSDRVTSMTPDVGIAITTAQNVDLETEQPKPSDLEPEEEKHVVPSKTTTAEETTESDYLRTTSAPQISEETSKPSEVPVTEFVEISVTSKVDTDKTSTEPNIEIPEDSLGEKLSTSEPVHEEAVSEMVGGGNTEPIPTVEHGIDVPEQTSIDTATKESDLSVTEPAQVYTTISGDLNPPTDEFISTEKGIEDSYIAPEITTITNLDINKEYTSSQETFTKSPETEPENIVTGSPQTITEKTPEMEGEIVTQKFDDQSVVNVEESATEPQLGKDEITTGANVELEKTTIKKDNEDFTTKTPELETETPSDRTRTPEETSTEKTISDSNIEKTTTGIKEQITEEPQKLDTDSVKPEIETKHEYTTSPSRFDVTEETSEKISESPEGSQQTEKSVSEDLSEEKMPSTEPSIFDQGTSTSVGMTIQGESLEKETTLPSVTEIETSTKPDKYEYPETTDMEHERETLVTDAPSGAQKPTSQQITESHILSSVTTEENIKESQTTEKEESITQASDIKHAEGEENIPTMTTFAESSKPTVTEIPISITENQDVDQSNINTPTQETTNVEDLIETSTLHSESTPEKQDESSTPQESQTENEQSKPMEIDSSQTSVPEITTPAEISSSLTPEIIQQEQEDAKTEQSNIDNITPQVESTTKMVSQYETFAPTTEEVTVIHKLETTASPMDQDEKSSEEPQVVTEKDKTSLQEDLSTPHVTETVPIVTEKPLTSEATTPEEIVLATTKAATTRTEEEPILSTTAKPAEKQTERPAQATEQPKPISTESVEDIPAPEDDASFPPSGGSAYGQEPDYMEEDQTFGPGTCRYGGKVYVSAQQIPRDDPCDFCFCFRSDIICLQQSCPPPIHGCHEEPIQGFCCPRYECPVSMATTVNVTTTTTTTTTTLPPHFPIHSYKGSAQRKGCLIKGQSYKVGDVVRASSGPCLHCTCGGDGQMKCDPKACTPEPMLRQMIAAAVSAKRRR